MFHAEDIASAIDEVGPFENVFLQESATMGLLADYMKKSLKELGRGFAGELTMSDGMEKLENSLYLGQFLLFSLVFFFFFLLFIISSF